MLHMPVPAQVCLRGVGASDKVILRMTPVPSTDTSLTNSLCCWWRSGGPHTHPASACFRAPSEARTLRVNSVAVVSPAVVRKLRLGILLSPAPSLPSVASPRPPLQPTETRPKPVHAYNINATWPSDPRSTSCPAHHRSPNRVCLPCRPRTKTADPCRTGW